MFAMLAFFAWLILPRIAHEFTVLLYNLPTYLDQATARLSSQLEDYPELQEKLRLDAETFVKMVPSLPRILGPVGRYSFSILGWIAVVIILVSTALYMVAKPRPLMELYLQVFPAHLRGAAARAFVRSSKSVVGWVWSNVLVGGIEGVAVFAFLSFIGIPSALVWAALAFFAELVPKLGPYLMALPPVRMALSIDPVKALWVALYIPGGRSPR